MKIPVSCILLAPFATAFTTRRGLIQNAAIATAGAVVVAPAASEAAITACPPKSKNCLTTTWTAPDAKAASGIADILNAYPQAGQNGVDLGGWKFVEDNLTSNGSAKLEYTSGVGNFAKFFNGGKPFVDDLSLEISDGGMVNIKSSSRIGESDLGVNQKRLQYLAAQARGKGWDAPDPTY